MPASMITNRPTICSLVFFLTLSTTLSFLSFSNTFILFPFLLYQFSSVPQSCPALWDSMDCNSPGSSLCGISQARIVEWVVHYFPQEILPTQGSNPGLPHCRQTHYHLNDQRSLFMDCNKEEKIKLKKKFF